MQISKYYIIHIISYGLFEFAMASNGFEMIYMYVLWNYSLILDGFMVHLQIHWNLT